MDQKGIIADLSIKSIATLCGMNIIKEVTNPRKPEDMAKQLKVTFTPIPFLYPHIRIQRFRKRIMEEFISQGVTVVPWKDAVVKNKKGGPKVRADFHAVVDMRQVYGPLRKILSHGVAERMYKRKRSDKNSVVEILKLGGWADNFALRRLQAPFKTQIITLAKVEASFSAQTTGYDEKIEIGLNHLIGTMSELVIGVAKNQFSLINMNLSDSTYPNEELKNFVAGSLIPKIFAPIRPPMLNRFKMEKFKPSEVPFTKELAEFSRDIHSTSLYPTGIQLCEKIGRLSLRDALSRFLDGRTGVSYGFMAMAESPVYIGEKVVSEKVWEAFAEIPNIPANEIRVDKNDRWYARLEIAGEIYCRQVPDVWIVTSRSGCDKTNLDPSRDIIRLGLIKGKLTLQTPEGIEFSRKDIRPSFDTEVILAQSLSSALYMPDFAGKGMQIVHFHGYPNVEWFNEGEEFTGQQNPSLPCGTMEAALLNFSGVYDVAQTKKDAKLFCLVESDHGVNIICPDKDYLLKRLQAGVSLDQIVLGGKYLRELKTKA